MSNVSVAKNTIVFISALVIQKILAFGFFIFIARVAGGQATGDYVGALAFATIFSIFLELGFSQVLIREIAKFPQKAGDYLNNVISLKISLMFFVYLALFLTLKFFDILGKGHPSTDMAMLAGLVLITDSFIMSIQSALRGYQNLLYESIVTVLSKILIIIIGVIGVWVGLPPYIFIIAILIGSLFTLAYSWYFLAKKYHYKFRFALDKNILKPFFVMALPFMALGMFSNIYAQIDVIILGAYKGSEAVGLYSVTSKTLNALQFIPMAFSAALYPAMSRYFDNDKASVQRIFEQGFSYLAMICVPMAVGIHLLAEPIVIMAYTEKYRSSILALEILAPSLVFAFLTFPVGALLNAGNKQKINTINMGIIMVINIVLNILLVPKMSFIGSAWAWFATNVIWFFLAIYWAGKLINYNKKHLLISFLKVLVSSLLMGLVVFYFKDKVNVLINIPIAGMTYVVAMFLVGGLHKGDLKRLAYELKIKI
jgi:O-antigen/teichoic acid export membrane protein